MQPGLTGLWDGDRISACGQRGVKDVIREG
jgi:hypothetical protein